MDDVIYRKDAAKILCNWCGVCPEDKRDIMKCEDICPEFSRIPSAQPEDWMERNKERILQAGMEGREIEFRIGGRLFAIREKAQ